MIKTLKMVYNVANTPSYFRNVKVYRLLEKDLRTRSGKLSKLDIFKDWNIWMQRLTPWTCSVISGVLVQRQLKPGWQRLESLNAILKSMSHVCIKTNCVFQGLKTLDDLKEHGNLNRQQQIGLKYYDEFLERMSRSEAEEIGNIVKQAAQDIDPALQCMICGSFRRGKSTCGDVDVLVSHPDGHSHQGVMSRLLENLKEDG